jgi:hypothetical protein
MTTNYADIENFSAIQNQASQLDGAVLSPSGVDSAANGANVLTPAFATGVPAQLSDTGRDYMVYLDCTTSGTALVVKIGPTSSPAHTIMQSESVTAGQLITVRVPAGWFFEWTATTAAFATQTAISC